MQLVASASRRQYGHWQQEHQGMLSGAASACACCVCLICHHCIGRSKVQPCIGLQIVLHQPGVLLKSEGAGYVPFGKKLVLLTMLQPALCADPGC